MIAGFYTYIHIRADDGKVFYVGKGKGKRAHSSDGRNRHWHNTVRKHGLRVEIVAPFATEADAFDNERKLIAAYRVECQPLCNKTDGGEGTSGCRPNEETRKKLSIALKKRSPECYAQIAAALRGRPRSEEARAKISAGRVGIKPSAHAIAMVKAANTGIVRSAEFRAKVSAGLTGRPVSQETREKIASAQRGRTVSQEKRDRISKTLTGRRLSDAEKERLLPLTHSAESRAKHSAAMKGRPWSEARRAAHNKARS